jgi:hypothetical protein
MNNPMKTQFTELLLTAPKKSTPNKSKRGRRPFTLQLLQLFLLPGLMAVLWVGCKQGSNSAVGTGESRLTNSSDVRTSEPVIETGVLSVRATASPASCAVGERTTITAVVSVGQGKPVPGAKVQIAAGGGRFLSSSDEPYDPKARLHGPYSVSGTSDREGRFVTWWVVNPAAPAYALDIRASSESQGEAQTNLQIVMKQ